MQQDYKCPECKQPVEYGVWSCENCGEDLHWEDQSMQPQKAYYKQVIGWGLYRLVLAIVAIIIACLLLFVSLCIKSIIK